MDIYCNYKNDILASQSNVIFFMVRIDLMLNEKLIAAQVFF